MDGKVEITQDNMESKKEIIQDDVDGKEVRMSTVRLQVWACCAHFMGVPFVIRSQRKQLSQCYNYLIATIISLLQLSCHNYLIATNHHTQWETSTPPTETFLPHPLPQSHLTHCHNPTPPTGTSKVCVMSCIIWTTRGLIFRKLCLPLHICKKTLYIYHVLQILVFNIVIFTMWSKYLFSILRYLYCHPNTPVSNTVIFLMWCKYINPQYCDIYNVVKILQPLIFSNYNVVQVLQFPILWYLSCGPNTSATNIMIFIMWSKYFDLQYCDICKQMFFHVCGFFLWNKTEYQGRQHEMDVSISGKCREIRISEPATVR